MLPCFENGEDQCKTVISTTVNLDEPIVVENDEHLHIECSGRLIAQGDFPAVIMAGNHATLSGRGWLEATAQDTEALLQIGTGNSNVTWPLISGIKLKGANGGRGIREVRPITGQSTYWGKIVFAHLERFDVGVESEFEANGQEYHGVSFQRITSAAYRVRSDMLGIIGGSVHFSPGVVIHDFIGARFCYSSGIRVEPGAGSRFAVLDANTLRNQIRGVSNIGLGPIDNGTENHLEWQANAD